MSEEEEKPKENPQETNNQTNPQLVHVSSFTRTIIDIHDLDYLLTKNTNHGVCGGHNLGNTCFMNSSIACLSNCTELTAYFLTGKYKTSIGKYKTSINKKNKQGLQGKLANAWYDLLKEYWETKSRTGNPSTVKSTVAKKAKIFGGFGQQDSNEFMTEFLSLLNEDLKKGKDESELDCAKRFWNLHLERNDSIITDLFSGLLKSDVKCSECGFDNITFDPFNTLTLAIPSYNYLNEKLATHMDITFYYIPKYCIGSNFRISLHVPKEIEYKDLPEEIKKVKEFPYKIDKLLFIRVLDSKLKNIMDPNEKKANKKEFIFSFDDLRQDENTKVIPLYMYNNQVISAFPRVLFLKDTTTFGELKKRIYFYARNFIKNPLANSKEEIEKECEIDEKIHPKKEKDDKKEVEKIPGDEVYDLIEKEYNQIFGAEENKEKLYIFKDFPYVITFKKNFDDKANITIFDGENNLENLKEFNIAKDEDSIASLIQDNEFCLNLFLNPTSSFSNPKINLNSCVSCEGEDFGKREKNMPQITLDDLLEYFCSNEHLDRGNEWKCGNCKKRVSITKKFSIFYVPKLLIICLKRFTKSNYGWGGYDKNTIAIDFPIENLDMGKYICGPDKAYSKYDLFAVSQHYGGTGGGHYTAVCKNIDGNWYSYNDSSVSHATASSAVTSAAYVLFYRRKNW